MTTTPTDLRYTREHEWVLLADDGTALVGITHFAQEELGDVIYVSLPEAGSQVQQHETMGEAESVKAVSDLFSPVSGEVTEVNDALVDHPEIVNQDPYGEGWMIRVRLADQGELANLLTAQEYDAFVAAEGH
jgi:glycine cleavage system H protein